jgi:hypothetical protein
MPLGPLRIACVQPAPKSRWVVSGLLRYEDQDQRRCEAFFAIGCFVLIVPTLRVVTRSMTLCVIRDVADAQVLRPSRNGRTSLVLIVPTLRVVTRSMTLCVIRDVAHAQALRPSRNGRTPLVLIVPTLRVVTRSMTLCVIRDVADAQVLRPSRNGRTPLV